MTGSPSQQDDLSETEARLRLARDGPNALPVSRQRSMWRLLREIMVEPMFLLLVACGTVYMVLGDRSEALMLLGFVVVVIAITFVQQRRTEQSLDALRELSSPQALVSRDGLVRRIAGADLVCGDIVLLAEGDRVPADMLLLIAASLALDESMLTGESMPVVKEAAASVYAGTLVTRGTARARVTATGPRSALGRIGQSLTGIGDDATPIQQETRSIVRRVAIIGLVLALGLALAYHIIRGDWLHGVLAGLTFAMAILPEELPVVLTLFLGLGAWRLARERVLARSIPTIELLGAATVLCVDKTGTLTANRMRIAGLWSEQAIYMRAATASGPAGLAEGMPEARPEALHDVLEYAVLASHRRAFDPMESAIGDAGQHLLANTEHLHADWTLVDDYPLSREMLAMSRVWQSPARDERMIAAKGAPEAIIDLCHMDPARGARIAAQVALLAADGLRVLGVARAVFAPGILPPDQHDFVFEFLGLVAIEDPVRADVPAAIAQCHAAGIRVVMITGDHAATALSIARQAGLATDGRVMSGAELAVASDATLRQRLSDTVVFCRFQPQQKLRLVQAFRARGDIVAMTGDGVNDAPALKAAHIGVAMGARGTDVAREAADLVLLNDDFASLVTAVRYGRRVFANLRKAITFVVAAHVPIVGLSIAPVLLGWPLLLMPVHILFLQLIIDPACSFVFEGEPIEPGAMTALPRKPEARLFDATVLVRGLWQGGGLLAILLAVQVLVHAATGADDIARAMTFTVLVLSSLCLIHTNCSWEASSWRRSSSEGNVSNNRVFGWIVCATLALLALILGVPAVRQLFAFRWPGGWLLAAGAGAALLSLLWFELLKWQMLQMRRRSVPA